MGIKLSGVQFGLMARITRNVKMDVLHIREEKGMCG